MLNLELKKQLSRILSADCSLDSYHAGASVVASSGSRWCLFVCHQIGANLELCHSFSVNRELFENTKANQL